MTAGIFITGTDTGVGKTFVAVELIKGLVKKGVSVAPMKPVETGCQVQDGRLYPADAMALKDAALLVDIPLKIVNPYALNHPLAPSLACGLEGKRIEIEGIKRAFLELSRQFDFVVVEGAGGLMVPIIGSYFFADLARDLALPIIIVSRPGLGTINHTLLTVLAARVWGLDLLGVVINYSEPETNSLAEKTNPQVIELLSNVPILGIVPFAELPNKKTELAIDSISEKLFDFFALETRG